MENNSFWSTTQGKATIKFAAWMVFIIVLIVVFAINGDNNPNENKNNNTNKEETLTFKNYEEMQNDLLNGCYSYNFRVVSEDNKIIYSGILSATGDIGYKENNEGIIKYSKEDGIIYKVLLDQKEEINNLYDESDKAFLDIKTLFTNLKEYLYNITKNESTREINYNKEGYKVVVKTDLENITNITITNENKTYELQFTNVGKCDNITNK